MTKENYRKAKRMQEEIDHLETLEIQINLMNHRYGDVDFTISKTLSLDFLQKELARLKLEFEKL